ncbi:MAG: hypothetical protein U1E70_00115 [Acetobacteraceae bacterium]
MTTINVETSNLQALATGLPQPVVGILPAGTTADVTVFTSAVQTINAVLIADAAANTPGNTALPPPNNFRFFDETVSVGGSVPGDAFKGAASVPGITGQFIDLTPDVLGIAALTPNQFLKSDTGNDTLSVVGGRNILSGGSGGNLFIGGVATVTNVNGTPTLQPSVDTFVSSATGAAAASAIINFHSGDDAAMLGVNAAYTFKFLDTAFGLELDAIPPATGGNAAAIVLQGYSTADIGTRLSFGISVAGDGTNYLFVHGN